MENQQTPKQIFDDQVKREIIYQSIAKALTVQLDIIYNLVMDFKKPTAEELVEDINLNPPRIKYS